MIRIFEIFFSISVIIIGLPIFIAISLLILLYDGFPIFFKHDRIGKGGNIIKVYKFRSMIKNAEEMLKKDQKLYEEYVKNDFKISADKDPRIMPFGKFLRKSSLDEIPQFINVIIGNMSIVGPRPVVKDELETLYKENQNIYKSVNPGITGLWQISGRSNIKGQERVKLDIETIKKKSLFFDCYIIIMTFFEVLRRRGAF